jgi:hypothetical protein
MRVLGIRRAILERIQATKALRCCGSTKRAVNDWVSGEKTSCRPPCINSMRSVKNVSL